MDYSESPFVKDGATFFFLGWGEEGRKFETGRILNTKAD